MNRSSDVTSLCLSWGGSLKIHVKQEKGPYLPQDPSYSSSGKGGGAMYMYIHVMGNNSILTFYKFKSYGRCFTNKLTTNVK